MKQHVHEYLIALHKQHGTLTPELVVSDARRKDSPLHELFEWDTKKAAQHHWEDVARSLIRNVRVVVVNEGMTLRAPYFVRDPGLPMHRQGYTTVEKLRTDADMAREAVIEECSRATAAFRRAQEVAAAVGCQAEVHDLLQETIALGNRVRQAA